MIYDTAILAGLCALGLVTLLKLFWRKVILKNPNYNFPKAFYVISVPVLSIAVTPLLALMGFVGYTLPLDWVAFGRNLIMLGVSVGVEFFGYNGIVKPMKDYRPTN